ncbi:hypothetical protein [Pseudarthrobacter sp. N5]|uniref:hypothetical protein n=1 Tax=Pseudarthrobacter sp. N5 TaxID=3418416 RepID=UPI003CE96A54
MGVGRIGACAQSIGDSDAGPHRIGRADRVAVTHPDVISVRVAPSRRWFAVGISNTRTNPAVRQAWFEPHAGA